MFAPCVHTLPLAYKWRDERGGTFSRSGRDTWAKTKAMSARSSESQIDIDALYRQYAPMVFRRCRSMLKNEERAQDAMQDTFINQKTPKTTLFRRLRRLKMLVKNKVRVLCSPNSLAKKKNRPG